MALTDKLTAIANAIRAKTGKTAKMTMTEMVTEIQTLAGGIKYTNTTLSVVPQSAYSLCLPLTSVYFPNVRLIENSAFTGCTNLVTAEFGTNLTSITSWAFQNCTALSALVIRTTSAICSIESSSLSRSAIASDTGYIYVPDSLVDSYKAATNWSTYAAQIKPLSEYTGG